ncbi:hypothetical protein CIK05_02040 [Bdellovibrio sp. qaytius]|nr:hypothetical protein CIK05_02040 [Bdellovibrio sp. qaytius]
MKNILLALSMLALFSCSYSRTSGGLPSVGRQEGGLSEPTKPGEEPAVRFADVKAAVFDTSCAGCHQKKEEDLSFADYANIKSFASEIAVRVFEERDMPPKKKLTELQEQVLRTWLDAGSPE